MRALKEPTVFITLYDFTLVRIYRALYIRQIEGNVQSKV